MRDGLLDSVRYINFCIYMLGQVVFDIVIDTRRRTKLKSGERRDEASRLEGGTSTSAREITPGLFVPC